MIKRNDPETIFNGVIKRKNRAALKCQHEKWHLLDAFSWVLFWRIAK